MYRIFPYLPQDCINLYDSGFSNIKVKYVCDGKFHDQSSFTTTPRKIQISKSEYDDLQGYNVKLLAEKSVISNYSAFNNPVYSYYKIIDYKHCWVQNK